MRSSSDQLIRLVATMSRQEKRYFRLYSRFYTKERGNHVLRLFEAIERLKPVSGAALAAAVAGEPYAKHLSILKKQLVEQILDSLLSYGTAKKAHELQRQVMYADVLMERGLYTHAAQTLVRAEKKAVNAEEHLLFMEILYRQRSLLFRQITPEIEGQIHDLYARGRNALAKILSTSAYREMVDVLQVIATRYAARPTRADREKMDAIVARLPACRTGAMSFADELSYYSALGTYALLIDDTAAALGYYRNIVQVWQRNKAMIEQYPDKHFRCLLNYLNCLVTEGTEEEFAAATHDIRGYLSAGRSEEQILYNLWNLEILFYLNSGKLDVCENLVAEVERNVPVNADPTVLFSLYHNCSIFCFLAGYYRRCLTFIAMLHSEAPGAIKQDVQVFSRIFSIVAHYELGNLDILDNMIRSAKRYMKKNNASGVFGKAVLSGVRSLVGAVDSGEKSAAFRALHHNLVDILHSSASEPLGIAELLFWTQSHLNRCTVRELFTQRMQSGLHSTRLLFPQPVYDANTTE